MFINKQEMIKMEIHFLQLCDTTKKCDEIHKHSFFISV
ncbi:hypothetical protein B4119_0811 [Parageobacillus caldoxylosilyticus]|uniref:Uncharacterized protein n=1 Tax=Saccharococcus caldoxylosilyticus TaxID=81408 RepID=A0A150M0N4_9BACL|nr:hypothetical protein B4119_0811 [Parageobacillus caldoxylosilyticus]